MPATTKAPYPHKVYEEGEYLGHISDRAAIAQDRDRGVERDPPPLLAVWRLGREYAVKSETTFKVRFATPAERRQIARALGLA